MWASVLFVCFFIDTGKIDMFDKKTNLILSALIGVSVFIDLIDVEPFRQVSNDGGAAVALLGVAEQVLVEVRHLDKLQNEIRTI
jgi:hypothetical protein